jgi:hypothetical protein
MCNHPQHIYCTPEMLPEEYKNRAGASQGAVMSVDWENRVDFDQLRRYRIQRVQDQLKKSNLGALLLFDMNNIRYTTASHIGKFPAQELLVAGTQYWNGRTFAYGTNELRGR